MLVFVLGLTAGALLGCGFVLQQRAAAKAPPEDFLSPRILIDLVRQPLWLAGIATMVAGQLTGAAALDHGNITLIESLLATNLLFALPISAAWSRRSLGRREWLGALVLMVGLGGFVYAAVPEGDYRSVVPTQDWLVSGLVIAGLVALLTLVAKRRELAAEATLLATGAGCCSGFRTRSPVRACCCSGTESVPPSAPGSRTG